MRNSRTVQALEGTRVVDAGLGGIGIIGRMVHRSFAALVGEEACHSVPGASPVLKLFPVVVRRLVQTLEAL